MTPAPRFSLWLLLPSEAQGRFQSLIAMLSARLATPAFEPHITLLSGLAGREEEMRARTRALAAAIKPFEIRLREATGLDEYYRCLFVKIARSHGLQEAHDAAKKLFDQRLEADFFPHLSLVYGQLDEQDKERILVELGRSFEEDLTIEEVALYETGSPNWRCIERRRLGKAAT